MTSFYKILYASTNPTDTTIDSFLDTPHLIKQLTEDHKRFLDSPITEQEILDVL